MRLANAHQSPISRMHEILKVGFDIVHFSKILGVTLDDQLCFNHMVNDTLKTCFFKLLVRKLRIHGTFYLMI